MDAVIAVCSAVLTLHVYLCDGLNMTTGGGNGSFIPAITEQLQFCMLSFTYIYLGAIVKTCAHKRVNGGLGRMQTHRSRQGRVLQRSGYVQRSIIS